MYAKRRFDKKSKLMLVYQLLVVFVEKATFFFLPNRFSNTTREIKSAENNEVRIPRISVVAKPRIDPYRKNKNDTYYKCSNVRINNGTVRVLVTVYNSSTKAFT